MIAPDSAAIAAMDALKAATNNAPEDTNVNDATPTTDATTTNTDAPAADAATGTDKMPRYVAITMTADLWDAINENLPANMPMATYLQGIVAEKLNVKVEASKRSKYASEEEKKAAQKAAAKSRADLIKALLAEHKAKMAQA